MSESYERLPNVFHSVAISYSSRSSCIHPSLRSCNFVGMDSPRTLTSNTGGSPAAKVAESKLSVAAQRVPKPKRTGDVLVDETAQTTYQATVELVDEVVKDPSHVLALLQKLWLRSDDYASRMSSKHLRKVR